MYVLVLDDSEINNLLMTEAVRHLPDCTPTSFTAPGDALAFVQARAGEIGVAVTDYDMPGMNGVEFIRAARQVPGFSHVPVVMLTSTMDRGLRREALEAGATDFLHKPLDVFEMRPRIANLLALSRARHDLQGRADRLASEVAKAVAVIEEREREAITLLMRATEHRDTDTGDHVARVSSYVAFMAEELGLDAGACRRLSLASTMHDIGKIAVPDAILLKPGPLSDAERREMERHAARGAAILGDSTSDLLRLAAEIALTHHERWDGTGYPRGLLGEAIPLSGRIMAVADVFDALTSKRPYKQPWSPEAARDHLLAQSGAHFDPACVRAFVSCWSKVRETVPGVSATA